LHSVVIPFRHQRGERALPTTLGPSKVVAPRRWGSALWRWHWHWHCWLGPITFPSIHRRKIMKRAASSDPALDGRLSSLKRANSSLFSIATLVDDDAHPTDATIAGLVGGGKSTGSLLLLDDDDADAGGGEDAPAPYSPLKARGLVIECSDDDAPVPDGAASSSCSSSDVDEEEEGVAAEAGKPTPTTIDFGRIEEAAASITSGALPALRNSKSDAAKELQLRTENTPEKVVASQCCPCEPPTSAEADCKRGTETATPADHRTGLVFEAGSKHYDRRNRFHKERPVRITSVQNHLAKTRQCDDEKTIFERCHLLEGRGENEVGPVESKRSPEELWLDDHDYLRVHLPGYMQRLDRIAKCNCHHRLDIEAEQFKSIYFTNDSVREAKAAASSLCRLVARVASGDLDSGFAVIRPPGHHAEPGLAGGYCVINNVAVAAAYAQEKLGMKKILIVDWDVHHGNGTQRCFIDKPDVLFFSAHRYHGGNFFPFLEHGGPTSVGTGAGEGFNINVGWNDKNMGDDEYLVLWEKLLMPVAMEFKPDLVLVSAGFDAARGDMGECDLSPECFARLTRRLKTLAGGKVVCALEGGYVRSVLCRCIESVVASLLDPLSDDKCKEELQRFHKNVGDNEMLDCINHSAARSIRTTMRAHTKYWACLATECNAGELSTSN
ncbi:hypothetical protein ACHAWF_012935, partial [Thalassiosira exigua]